MEEKMSDSKHVEGGRLAKGKRSREKTTPEASPVLLSPAVNGDYAFLDVKQVLDRVLQQCADDAAKTTLTKGDLLSSLFKACEMVAYQQRLEAPLDREALQQQVQEALGTAAGEALDAVLIQTLTETLTTQLAEEILNRPTLPASSSTAKKEMTEGAQPVSGRPDKRSRTEASLDSCLLTTAEASSSSPTDGVWCRGGILPTPPPLPSVFSESGACSVDCVAFDNVPAIHCTPEAMRRQLEKICARIPNALFLNILCLPDESRAIVSFNTKETAAAVIFAINSFVKDKSTGVRVAEASEAQQQLLLEPLAARVKAQEEQWRCWRAKYEAYPAHRIRKERAEALAKDAMLQEELRILTSSGGDTNQPEGATMSSQANAMSTTELLQRKKELLLGRLECKGILEKAVEQMRLLYGDAYMENLEKGPLEAKYSSSSAIARDVRKVLFIRELPRRLDDAEVLQFLCFVGVQPVHIWRESATETTLCVAVPSVGHVFSVLRSLEGTEMRFDGALFSRDLVCPAKN
ncbi:putative protein kinase [Trypanosoma grayi]|uniref:putative protein kinase n=1 Tax=Trypanosoma grayi TaxID=71804 RepID=UPI0004F4BE4A|nr:putative protein kinase [Trypanosoma grayi]KEG12471.1 putative protein kinase [Trypanosoma grayi]